MKKQHLYIGIDPGLKNFAIAALNSKGDLIFVKMLHSTVQSMKKNNAFMRPKFRNVMRKILDFLGKQADSKLLIEQFVVRGFGANIIELINIMIGGVMMHCDALGIEENAIMASTWKNYFNRQVSELDAEYEHARLSGVPPHIVDAILLATYLHGNMSFANFKLSALRKNVLVASSMLPVTDLIKPKRITKKNELPVVKSARGRKVPKRKVLVSPHKSKRKLQRS